MTYEPIMTAAAADTILAGHWRASGWVDLDEEVKDALLAQASRMVEYLLAVPTEDADQDRLQYATALQASWLSEHGATMARAMKDGIEQVKAMSLQGMAQTKAAGTFNVAQMYHPEVKLLLRDYIQTGAQMRRV